MKALHEKVNIVPVLAKADTLTPSEVKKKKIKASSPEASARWRSHSKKKQKNTDAHTAVFLSLLCPQIREEIEQYGIKIYQFPDCDSDEDEDFKQQDAELKVRPATPGVDPSLPPPPAGRRGLLLKYARAGTFRTRTKQSRCNA